MSMPGNRTFGVVLRDALPWPDARAVVETAEDTGYQSVFVPEISAREAFTTLTGFAHATSTFQLGTGVVTMWARSPATTAMAAATLQDVSGGRFILGLGAGTPPPGQPARGTHDRLRAYLRVVRTALAGEEARDDRFGDDGFRLELSPVPNPPPILLGALGDRTLALGGAEADGVLMNWCTPERVKEGAAIVRRAAEDAGRDPVSVTVAVYVRACLGVEEDTAVAALRPMVARYASIPSYRTQMARMGLKQEAERATAALDAGRPNEVPESLVRALTVLGGRTEALARFDAYRDAGADLILCYPVPALDPLTSILGTIMTAAPDPAVQP
jgi:alkanesulfonate monooxygenase SsuD/methylene tetrahydromethanopterin reductase-like flavin-dependent oxidoreductase (luciferase family)